MPAANSKTQGRGGSLILGKDTSRSINTELRKSYCVRKGGNFEKEAKTASVRSVGSQIGWLT